MLLLPAEEGMAGEVSVEAGTLPAVGSVGATASCAAAEDSSSTREARSSRAPQLLLLGTINCCPCLALDGPSLARMASLTASESVEWLAAANRDRFRYAYRLKRVMQQHCHSSPGQKVPK